MDWKEFVFNLLGLILASLMAWVLAKVKTLIDSKVNDDKAREFLMSATSIISSTVKMTYQTYVEEIKGTDAWTAEAQRNALQKAANAARLQMTEELKAYITTHYGDLEMWIETQIEAELYDLKK